MEHTPFSNVIGLFVSLGIVTIVFLVFREAICWYWKINEGIALLTEIRDMLRDQNRLPRA